MCDPSASASSASPAVVIQSSCVLLFSISYRSVDSMIWGTTTEGPCGDSARDLAFLSIKHSLLLALFQCAVFLQPSLMELGF